MAKSLSHQPVLLPINGATLGKISKAAAVLMLALALGVPPQVMFGQSNQQQEQQQREQQQREQQQREQQQREQQQRDQQQREQQQREQQQRDQQQREEQQREQQQRDQQQRDQQQRDQQQRDQQQHSSSNSSAPSSDLSHPAKLPATDVKPTTSDGHPLNVERKTDSSPAENRGATKKQTSTAIDHDLHGKICAGGPCKAPATQPIQVKSSAPERDTKLCKGGHCQPCPAGESRAKDGSCVPGTSAKPVAPPPGSRPVIQQLCAAGQVWNGTQCQLVGAQACTAEQLMVGASCQTDCTIATAGAQSIIVRLRSARQEKDEACLQNPAGKECQIAEADYDLTLSEYRSFLGGVRTECQTTLPDPIAI